MNMSVCLSVCLSVCPRGYLRNHAEIFTNFSVHVALRRRVTKLKRRGSFFRGGGSPLTMHCNTFIAKGIGREGGGRNTQRVRSVLSMDYGTSRVAPFMSKRTICIPDERRWPREHGLFWRNVNLCCCLIFCASLSTY